MGTKLGNLHILGTTVEEVATLLPGAVVGQWAEGVVSAFEERFQVGEVEREARRISRKLPQAVVLSASIFDSDMIQFELYQGGKRLSAHRLDPYEGKNKSGKPGLFCGAFGLSSEDEARLKVVWKKGDADEQMELTGLLFGIPTYFDEQYSPEGPVKRDVAAVDAWIAEHPDPPKIKSVTKVVCIQEIWGMADFYMYHFENNRLVHLLVPLDEETGKSLTQRRQFWKTTPEGTLAPAWEEGLDQCQNYTEYEGGRVMGFDETANLSFNLSFDSAGHLPAPLSLYEVGKEFLTQFSPTSDGGFWYSKNVFYDREWVIRYGADGVCLARWPFPKGEQVVYMTAERVYTERHTSKGSRSLRCYDRAGDLRGERKAGGSMDSWSCDGGSVWFLERDCQSRTCALIRCTPDLEILARSPGLKGSCFEKALSPDGDRVFCSAYKDGLWILDGRDLSIQAERLTKDPVYDPRIDGHGRFWVMHGGTLVGYDARLEPVSRHRIYGNMVVNGKGDLCVQSVDHKKRRIGVYRVT